MAADSERIERERDFWDHTIPTVEEAIADYDNGPSPNTALMLDSMQVEPGMKVLDFACGGGLTSSWLADRGADVTAIDLSPASIRVARAVAEHAGHTDDIEFLAEDVEKIDLPPGGFDAIVGRYALHHLDTERMAPALARTIRPGGRGAFQETFGINPILRFSRNHLIGRFGIRRVGTLDEHPLEQHDLDLYEAAFGTLRCEVAQYKFFRIFDRQVLSYRSERATRALERVDDTIHHRGLLPQRWSFHQVVVVEKTA